MARGDLILTVLAPQLTADIQSQLDALVVQFSLQERAHSGLLKARCRMANTLTVLSSAWSVTI